MLSEFPDSGGRITWGGDKAYDTVEHVALVRELGATPHVAQNDTNRQSAIDGRTTRHPGYEISLSRALVGGESFRMVETNGGGTAGGAMRVWERMGKSTTGLPSPCNITFRRLL